MKNPETGRGTDSAKMARKNKFARKGGEHFDTASGQMLSTDRLLTGSIKAKIEWVREVVPNRSKDAVAMILQSCDNNVEAAVSCFTSGEADDILGEWSTQGRKNGAPSNRKKKNKKKQAAIENGPDMHGVDNPCNEEELERTVEQTTVAVIPSSSEASPGDKPTVPQLVMEPAPSSSDVLSQPSSSDSTVSSPTSPPSTEGSREMFSSSEHAAVSHKNQAKKLLPSSGPDALKKTVKDLQRSSVTLPRFQLLLEEECDKSTVAMSSIFKELRQCLNEREVELASLMKQFKEEALELLQQRQENAAALKLKAERVGGMDEAHTSELRNEIRNFVSERKFDEELAKTTRFVRDEEKLIQEIKTFGEVVPIKHSYKPVMLNPAPPSCKPFDKSRTTSVNQTLPVVISAAVAPSPSLVNTDRSLSSSHMTELQQTAEMHARLQATLKLQGIPVEEKRQRKERERNNVPAAEAEEKPNSANHLRESPEPRNVRQVKRNEGRPNSANKRVDAPRNTRPKREEKPIRDRLNSSNKQGNVPQSPGPRNMQPKREQRPMADGPNSSNKQGDAPQSPGPRNRGAKGEERPQEDRPNSSNKQGDVPRSPGPRNRGAKGEERPREDRPNSSNKQGDAPRSPGPRNRGAKGEERPQEDRPNSSNKQGDVPRSPGPRKGQLKIEERPKEDKTKQQGETPKPANLEDHEQQQQQQQGKIPASKQEPPRKVEQRKDQEGEQESRLRRNRNRGRNRGQVNKEEIGQLVGMDQVSEVAQKGGPSQDKEVTIQGVSEGMKKKEPRNRKRRADSAGGKDRHTGTASGKEGNGAKLRKDEGRASKEGGASEEIKEQRTKATEVQEKLEKTGKELEKGMERVTEAHEEPCNPEDMKLTSKEIEKGPERGTEAQEKPRKASKEIEEETKRVTEAHEEQCNPEDMIEASKEVEKEKESATEAQEKLMKASKELEEEKERVTEGKENAKETTEASQEKGKTDHAGGTEISQPNGTDQGAGLQGGSSPEEALPQRNPRPPRRRNTRGRGRGRDPKQHLKGLNANGEHSVDHDVADNRTSSLDTKAPQDESIKLLSEPLGDTKPSPPTALTQQAPEEEEAAGDDGKSGSKAGSIQHNTNGFIQMNGTIDECLVER